MGNVDLRKYCQEPDPMPARKGRSESLLSKRDEKLASRFYYYSEIQKVKNYSKILSLLAEMFDINENVVRTRLKKRVDILDRVYADKPSVNCLRKKYPYYCW